MDVFHARGEEAAGACCWVIDGADDAGLGQCVVVLHEDERGGEAYDVARGEVLTRSFIRPFRELADEFLEHESHLVVGYFRWAEVGGADFLDDLVEQVGIAELADEVGEVEVLKDLAGIGGERLDVGL